MTDGTEQATDAQQEGIDDTSEPVDWGEMDNLLFGDGAPEADGDQGAGEQDAEGEQQAEGDAGEDSDAGSDEDGDTEAGTATAEEQDQVDYELLVPMPDGPEGGEKVTLGNLKNEVIDFRRREVNMRRQELELAGERRLLEAVAANGGQVTPQIRQGMAQLQQQRMEREAAMMFENNPAWKDPAVFGTAQKELAAVAKTFGATDKEIANINSSMVVEILKEVNYWRKRAEASKGVRQQAKQPSKRVGSKTVRKTGRQSTADAIRSARTPNGVDWGAVDKKLGL